MKDSYWFKHDSNASRDMKLIKLRSIYDFWGLGLYWCIIEFLREQDEYKFPCDESGLQIACNSVFCSDMIRFTNWFNDCIRFGLLKIDNGCFFSDSLIVRMEKWEIKKINGSKGGRPIKTETITESISETKPLDKIRVYNIEERKQKFIDELSKYKDKYESDILNGFYQYWVEPTKNGKKMKWETEATWDISLRLKRWERNQQSFKRK